MLALTSFGLFEEEVLFEEPLDWDLEAMVARISPTRTRCVDCYIDQSSDLKCNSL